ncbi:MAG: LysR family transcriptional regulator [Tabrizicola sp.]|nr:LysR family transcriptional regulator [Tabrizicola sp.]
MNMADLSLFAETARAGSFAAVARARGTDPSTISRSVASLEAELGVRLFQRTTRSLALTEAGDLYLSRALPLIEELARIGSEARATKAETRGTLRLTASVTFGQAMILPLLPGFRAAYPDISLECLFTDQNLDLVADRIDLAVRLAPAIEGDVIASKLMSTRYRVVASPGYLAKAPPLAAPGELAGHRFLLFSIRPFRNRWIFRDAAGRLSDVPVRGDLVISPAGAILDAALAGLGVALLPNYLSDPAIADGRLTRLLTGWEVTATTFDTGAWIVYPSRSFLPAKTRAMIDFLGQRLPRAPVLP